MADGPFDGVRDFISEVNRMRSYGVHGHEPHAEESERTHASAWVPATDILASGDDLVIRLELPGIEPEDVDLRLTHGWLTISGKRTGGPDVDDFFVRERYYGAFRRTVELPEGAEADDIGAEFDNGLVTITIAGGAAKSSGTQIALVDTSKGTKRGTVRNG